MNIIKIIKDGGIGVLPTDTLYGLVGSAMNSKTVERIYKLRRRSPDKPCIILISSTKDLKLFGIKQDKFSKDFLQKNWPNPLSVILACSPREAGPEPKFKYLHRGTKSLAFRIPANDDLRAFLALSGPLIVPSANFEGEKPSETIQEAKKYFGNKVDFYQDGGKLSGQPSTLIKIKNHKIDIIRQGAFTLNASEVRV